MPTTTGSMAIMQIPNTLVLPVYDMQQGINPFVFLGLNGYGSGGDKSRSRLRRSRAKSVAAGQFAPDDPASFLMGCGTDVWPEEIRYGGP
jgi:hypothetical protein